MHENAARTKRAAASDGIGLAAASRPPMFREREIAGRSAKGRSFIMC
jgi:hypothetical protein